jgi:hypothetical protein
MKVLVSLLCSLSTILAGEPAVKLTYPPTPRDYLWTIIACDEREEHFATEAFDAFLALIARRELKQEELCFPASFAVVLPNYIVLSRAFYVSQNELRGFEISVPKQCVTEKDGVLRLTAPVVVEKEDRRQGITLFVLKRKEPNQSLQPTALLGRG